mmetsp:Transcript_37656/g.97150  ORF Transcript_37656/g.97150 Transcript_37656/m.97150 type:complete len:83 (+) Transcript_37656:277-525(+)
MATEHISKRGRSLTATYDLHAAKELVDLMDWCEKELRVVYQTGEEDAPVEIDLDEVFEIADESERRAYIEVGDFYVNTSLPF